VQLTEQFMEDGISGRMRQIRYYTKQFNTIYLLNLEENLFRIRIPLRPATFEMLIFDPTKFKMATNRSIYVLHTRHISVTVPPGEPWCRWHYSLLFFWSTTKGVIGRSCDVLFCGFLVIEGPEHCSTNSLQHKSPNGHKIDVSIDFFLG
jgi:hypothetical protein